MATTIHLPNSGFFTVDHRDNGNFHVVLESLEEGSALAEVTVNEGTLRHMLGAIATTLDSQPTKKKPQPFTRTTEELEEILDDHIATKDTGSYELVADDCELPVPEEGLYPTRYIGGDTSFIIVFNNGHVEFLDHAEPADNAPMDGDLWSVAPLGWA